jgi:hypothetical protein
MALQISAAERDEVTERQRQADDREVSRRSTLNRSSPRKRGPSGLAAASVLSIWIPAGAGMSGTSL